LFPIIGTSRRELFQPLESHGAVVPFTKPWTAMASDSHLLAATLFRAAPDAQAFLESGRHVAQRLIFLVAVMMASATSPHQHIL
jgi:hypothetical protein